MRKLESTFGRCTSGQAMVETALLLPLLLMIILNCINFGYFFLVALNVSAAPRTGAQYAVMGSQTPGGALGLPAVSPATTASTVSYLTYQDMTGALFSPGTKASIQVCSESVLIGGSGVSGTGVNQRSNCVTCTTQASCGGAVAGASAPKVPSPDPEAPTFVLSRVDVTYTFNPLIPGTPFGITLLASPFCTSVAGTIQCTFHRQVSMRSMD